MLLVPVANSSDYKATTSGEVDFDTTMLSGTYYLFTCDQDCYIKQGTTPAAGAADGSMYVPKGLPVVINGGYGPKLSVIRKDTDGSATLQEMAIVRG